MKLLKDSQLGVITFFGLNEELGEKCGSNGLPLTPSSIQMIGRFQLLKSLSHPNLCKYLEIQRGKQDMLLVISEHNSSSLIELLKNNEHSSEFKAKHMPNIAHGILTALNFLHDRGIVHRNLSLENVSLSNEGMVSLSQFGLYHLTYHETLVAFRVGCPFYFAPEVFVCRKKYPNDKNVDIYAFGVFLLDMIMDAKLFKTESKWLKNFVLGLLEYAKYNSDGSMLEYFYSLKKPEFEIVYEMHASWFGLIKKCLNILPSKRPTIDDLLKDPIFNKLSYEEVPYFKCGLHESFVNMRRTDHLIPNKIRRIDDIDVWLNEPIKRRPIEEVYFLWKLAGSDVEIILDKKGLIKTNLPVLMLPNLLIGEFDIFGCEKQRRHVTDLSVFTLSMKNLIRRLKTVRFEHYYPSLEYNAMMQTDFNVEVQPSESSVSLISDNFDASQLPKVVKEKDIEYQLIRMVLFNLLLDSYPFKRAAIWQDSRVDVPPLYRGFVWCALLDVKGDVEDQYDAIDKETVTPTDRQIEVDVPRCHQYDELLSSPESHSKFTRILKAWVISHPEYVYWQGLDSLCAPFLHLNFNFECLAFACLKNFIPKYLHNFFLKDNSAVMQEYLLVFDHLIGFHDPSLYFHLHDIGFSPDLYAIPWFLTMFAHLLPLHKLFHLWDTLLLGNNSFPLCVGVAVLLQMRNTLMDYGFNECIMLFSDLPEIDIEQCVRTAVKIFCTTPKSATYRQHMPHAKKWANQSSSDIYQTGMFMEPIPLVELRAQHCPRLCAQELVDLNHKKETNSENLYLNLLCVDIRPFEEFIKGTFPHSINVPHNLVFVDGIFNLNGLACNRLKSHQGKLVCVIGLNSGDKRAFQVAENLMRLGYSQVVTLHNGIEVLRQQKLIVSPNSL